MTKIIRTPTRAEGGITPDEKAAMADITQEWLDIAFRTEPADPAEVERSIKALYAAADLAEPRVVLAPSPLVMAFAFGAAAAIWQARDATEAATRAATRAVRATFDATAATYAATHAATEDATRDAAAAATYAIFNATAAATAVAIEIDATEAATYAAANATRVATEAAADATADAATSDAIHDAVVIAAVATAKATDVATRAATLDAATDAAFVAIDAATDASLVATLVATLAATDGANRAATAATDATFAAIDAAAAVHAMTGSAGLECAKRWADAYNGGNMWAGPAAYFAALRDVLGLTGLDCWEKYQAYENAARAGGFRVMHEKFCIVSDFPAELHVDENNLPHNETGPSHRWRDGWAIYHWHGTRVPQHWIENRADLSPEEVLACEDVEQRAAGVAIIGMANMLDKLDHRVVDQHQTDGEDDHDMGALIEVTLPGLDEPGLYLRAHCPRNGWIMEGVADRDDGGRPIRTALHAQAWRVGLEPEEFRRPQRRT